MKETQDIQSKDSKEPQFIDSNAAAWLRSRRATLHTQQELHDFIKELRELQFNVKEHPGASPASLLWAIPAAIGIFIIGLLLAGAIFIGADAFMGSLTS